MRNAPSGADSEDTGFLCVVAWHLTRMRSVPRAFWRLRRLERVAREDGACLWVHRWISRRSLALTMRWSDEAEARRWLDSEAFHAASTDLTSSPGAAVRIEFP